MKRRQIFIINGSGGVGKDAFVKMVMQHTTNKKIKVENYSSVSKIKKIAEMIGWTGTKTEKDRKFLSDLKLLTTEYNDMPMNDMKNFADNFMDSVPSDNIGILFLHIREPKELKKAVEVFKEKYNVKTVLIKRSLVKQITSNMADKNVYNYNYDIVINNNGTLEELRIKAKSFLNDFRLRILKKNY
jgi:hypothetical protein